MKLHPLTTAASDKELLEKEYKEAREIGIVKIGETCLFFRKQLKVLYIPFKDIRRCFRRVMLVPARMCCGKGDLAVENLVICTEAGEIAEVQLPGTKAAKVLMEELKAKMPDVDFTSPGKKAEQGEENAE